MNQRTAFMLTSVAIIGYATAGFPEIGFAPAWGQDLTPRVGPASSSTSSTASIPDFSGIWGHPYITGGLEPPLVGPGPVTNRSRRNGVSNVYQYVGDYSNPILKPQAAEVVKNPGQPVLARRRALHFLEFRNADDPAARQDHHPLFQRS
jgi:hypothetical protein